jgi:hypothetical protein
MRVRLGGRGLKFGGLKGGGFGSLSKMRIRQEEELRKFDFCLSGVGL